MALLISFFSPMPPTPLTRDHSVGRPFSLCKKGYSPESPLQLKSPRCGWAACLISTDYSQIGVLQNTMTSALFIDGINHSLTELKIPREFVLSSLFLSAAEVKPLILLNLFLHQRYQPPPSPPVTISKFNGRVWGNTLFHVILDCTSLL